LSSLVKSGTALLNKELLQEALNNLGIEYEMHGENIKIKGAGRYEDRELIWNKEKKRYDLQQYDHVGNRWINEVSAEYSKVYTRRENARLEAERKQYQEKQKEEILKKAKANGYTAKEIYDPETKSIKLTLRRNVF